MARIYHNFCRGALLPVTDKALRRSISRRLAFLEDTQWWDHQKLLEYQNKQIKKTIALAYNSTAYYRRIFDELEITPEDIQSVDDLVKLPLLNKSSIRHNGVDMFLADNKEKLIKSTTSGSSGQQATVYLSREAESFTIAAELLFFYWGGYRLGSRHLQTGISLPRSFQKRVKDVLFRCKYVSAFHLSEKDLDSIYSYLKKGRTKILIGYASSLYCIALHVDKRRGGIKLDAILSLGDTLYSHYRSRIEAVFGCSVTDTYGCCEGFQIAGQCPEMKYHNCMPLNYIEILDEDDKRVKPGERGRVVLTRLDSNPMPLIRYEVGDLAVISKKQTCNCTRQWLILDSVQGRDTDIVVTPSGYKLIVHFFTGIFEHESRIAQFMVVQEKLDSIVIKVVPSDGFCENALERIKRQIGKRCNYDLAIDFEVVDKIEPANSGKRRFVISNISPYTREHAESTG